MYKDVINDRTQLKEMQKKQQEEKIQRRIKEHEDKKKQDRSQILFEVQTKGTFEPLPLFSPFATSAADKQDDEEEDPFLKSIFKLSPSPEEIKPTICNSNKYISIDPGLRTFLNCKTNDNYIEIGKNVRDNLKKLILKIDELNKIKRVIQKQLPDAPHEVMLVLDGSTGQNALEQAKQFMAVTNVNALAITKLDGTAKGGVVLAIAHQCKIPVKYIGVGEQINDLLLFDKNEFVDSLFSLLK